MDGEDSKHERARLKEEQNVKVEKRHVWTARQTLLVRTEFSGQTCAELGSLRASPFAGHQSNGEGSERKELAEACWVWKSATAFSRSSRTWQCWYSGQW